MHDNAATFIWRYKLDYHRSKEHKCWQLYIWSGKFMLESHMSRSCTLSDLPRQHNEETIWIDNAAGLTEVILESVAKEGGTKSQNLFDLGSLCSFMGQGPPPQILGPKSQLNPTLYHQLMDIDFMHCTNTCPYKRKQTNWVWRYVLAKPILVHNTVWYSS